MDIYRADTGEAPFQQVAHKLHSQVTVIREQKVLATPVREAGRAVRGHSRRNHTKTVISQQ